MPCTFHPERRATRSLTVAPWPTGPALIPLCPDCGGAFLDWYAQRRQAVREEERQAEEDRRVAAGLPPYE